jgi:phosphoribosylglycinamide formyltransferase-1
MSGKLKLGVLASGRGSNLQSIIDRCAAGTIDAEVAVVISDMPAAYALERARQAGIPALGIDRKQFPDRESFDRSVAAELQAYGVELLILAGYMRIMTEVLVTPYLGRMMNIHPALAPAFSGKGMHGIRVHEAVLDYGAKITGLTVHFVELEVDMGPIILQRCVPVREDDTPETLSARVLIEEHEVYPEAIQLYAQGRLRIEGRCVRVLPE